MIQEVSLNGEDTHEKWTMNNQKSYDQIRTDANFREQHKTLVLITDAVAGWRVELII